MVEFKSIKKKLTEFLPESKEERETREERRAYMRKYYLKKKAEEEDRIAKQEEYNRRAKRKRYAHKYYLAHKEPEEEEVEARNMERIVSRNIDALGKRMDLKLDTISDSVGEVRHLKELMLKSVA